MTRFITPLKSIECPRFTRSFSGENVVSCSLRITGLGVYRAFFNSERLGDGFMTPGFNDYDAYVRYEEFDLTPMLRPGTNTISVYMGKGWAMSRLGPNSGLPYHWGDTYRLWAELRFTYADGRAEALECADDDGWRAYRSEITMSELYDGEHRDDTTDPGNPVACRAVDTDYILKEWDSPKIRGLSLIKPELIVSPKGEYILDFRQNFAGIIRFHSRLRRGEKVLIQTCEVLQEGCFYRDNLLTALSEFEYTSDGEEKDVEPFFAFYGFRYAKVSGIKDVDPADFTGAALSSDIKQTLDIATGHAKLNRLILNAVWGQRSNFLDMPTDCPQRDERLGWLGDAQAFAATACYQLDCREFYRKFMRDMRYEQTRYYSGDLPMYIPSLKKESEPGGAVWADAAAILPWEVYMAYGDRALLRENYPMMRDYAETLIARDRENGFSHTVFTDFTFGDWLAQDGVTSKSVFGGTDSRFIQCCYYMRSVELTAKAAEALGHGDDAEKYAALAADIRAATEEEYFTRGGRLALDTQTAYVLALRHGLGNKDAHVRSLRERLRKDNWALKCGFTGAPLALPVMFGNGMEEEAFRLLLAEDFPSWLYEVNMGATTIWERWNSMLPDGTVSDTGMNSFNHYAYGSVCEAVYSCVAGLKNAAPGWKKAVISPRMDYRVGSCRLVFESVSGVWCAEWELKDDGAIAFAADVPEGTEARIILPDFPGEGVFNVAGGHFEKEYVPVRDYLRPFGGKSLILDLMRCEEARETLKKYAPDLWDAALVEDSDVSSWRLDRLTWGVPKKARAEVPALAAALEKLTVRPSRT